MEAGTDNRLIGDEEQNRKRRSEGRSLLVPSTLSAITLRHTYRSVVADKITFKMVRRGTGITSHSLSLSAFLSGKLCWVWCAMRLRQRERSERESQEAACVPGRCTPFFSNRINFVAVYLFVCPVLAQFLLSGVAFSGRPVPLFYLNPVCRLRSTLSLSPSLLPLTFHPRTFYPFLATSR